MHWPGLCPICGMAGRLRGDAELCHVTTGRVLEEVAPGKWLLLYRRPSCQVLRQAIAAHAGDVGVYVLPSPRAVRRFVAKITSGVPDSP